MSSKPLTWGLKLFKIGNFFGAIAQLVERLHGMQEVSGSIPLSSTKEDTVCPYRLEA